eukprot:XP_012824183.1 PREDICTED: cyclin-O protein B-like [Xenopus tropicalis]
MSNHLPPLLDLTLDAITRWKAKKRKRRREEEEEQEEEIISPGCSPEFKRAKPQGDLRGTSTPTAEEPVPEGEPWNTLTNLADALQTFREYGEECYLYKKGLEGGYQLENFLENQKEINAASWNHITTLMINVHRYLRLDFQTLCLGINFLERYVSCTPTDPDTLTRVGATCLYMAYKVAELRYPLPPKLFLPLFDYRMTPAEMRHLERTILRKLLFRLGVPTIDFFLEHFSLLRLTNQEECSPAQLTRAAKSLTAARGIAALCLNQHQDFYMHKPSLMALCCLNVADKIYDYNNPVRPTAQPRRPAKARHTGSVPAPTRSSGIPYAEAGHSLLLRDNHPLPRTATNPSVKRTVLPPILMRTLYTL